jgi:pyruvate,water dikinase
LWQIYYVEANPVKLPGEYPFCGNICGRPYLNLSLIVSMYRAVGKDIRQEMHGDIIGSAQSDLDIPIIPFSPFSVIWMVLPGMIKARRYASRDGGVLSEFIFATPKWCGDVCAQIPDLHDKKTLSRCWKETIKPYFAHGCNLLRSVTMQFTDPSNKLRLDLTRLVGEADANTLMSNVTANSAGLESLMPLVGLSQVARGEMSRVAYLERYGHRGPHELELFAPGSDEDPGWFEKQLADFTRSPVDVESLLADQRSDVENVWKRFQAKHPREAQRFQWRLGVVAAASRNREAVRSEVSRITRLARQFLLQVGKVTEQGDGIFFLSLAEITDVLNGDNTTTACIPARRETYQKYCALPAYPAMIIGGFDPFKWASDPNRRSDIFDSRHAESKPTASIIKGFAGAVGCVEGIVRRIDRMEDGNQIQPGEILVTATTNVGWTPLFPRLAAIVTDVGAPLSHAAIVAREMGIPAVVGCGNATMNLKTGDRVRVDGARGIVEILS